MELDIKEGDKKKLIVAGVLLVAAVGLIGWYFVNNGAPRPGAPLNGAVIPAAEESAEPGSTEDTSGSGAAPTGN